MKIEKGLIGKVLEKLYEDYFPSFCHKDELSKAVGIGKGDGVALGVEAVTVYLEDKGLITVSAQKGCRITAEGIDRLEGESLI